jgi:hypothetical protein
MQRVKMLRTVPGTLDGFTPFTFEDGKEYEINDEMVRGLIAEGAIELVLEAKPEPKLEAKRRKGRK